MIWSNFNILYTISGDKYFLYNSRVNRFFRLEKSFFLLLQNIEKDIKSVEFLNLDQKEFLCKNKILVEKNGDANFISQLRYLKLRKSFLTNVLELIIAPTLGCNFACPYCYEKDLPSNVMTEDVQQNLISFIRIHSANMKEMNINWHGGEPLLGFRAIKSFFYKLYNETDVPISQHRMVSNGFLFDEEKCLFFRDVNLNFLQITIDGTKEIHDKSRIHKSGIGTYDKIVHNVDMILDIMPKCNVSIRVNIYKGNEDIYPVIYNELHDRWKSKNCIIYPAIVMNQGACSSSCLSPSNRAQFYLNLYKKYGYPVEFTPQIKLGSCDAIYENTYVVDPDGFLYKCWADIGIKSRSIGNVIEGVSNLEYVSAYMISSDKFSDETCLNCKIFPICDGGCNRFRIEYQYKGIPYKNCPVDRVGLVRYLEVLYSQRKCK